MYSEDALNKERGICEQLVQFQGVAESNNGMHPTANQQVRYLCRTGAAGDAERSASSSELR